MGKQSAPATPNYMGATQLQGELNKENLNSQNYANRPTISTPLGTQSWGTQAVKDPATGQIVTQWTQNNSLAPGLQGALQDQLDIQAGRSELANNFMGSVAQSYANPMDYSNLPERTAANMPGSLQTGTTDYVPGLKTGFDFGGSIQKSVDPMTEGLQSRIGTQTLQRNLATQDNPALPQFDSSYRDTVANQLMQKMQPAHDYQNQQLETQLANQGLRAGSEAYNRATHRLGQQQANERWNSLDAAGTEAQRLYGMQIGSRQQAFNEDTTAGNFYNTAANNMFNQGLQSGQFANQAAQQAYSQNLGAAGFANQAQQQGYNQNLGAAQFQNQALNQAQSMDLANMSAGNQAMVQQYGMNQQYANSQNQLRQAAIAEQLQQRGSSLNEMNALLSGQQVQMPNMPSFNTSGMAQTPNYAGAMQNTYDANLGAVNAQNAATGNLMSGLGSLASSSFMFSDRRLKSNIKRVGEHSIGVGIYDYDMMGFPQRGVIAQEVQKVRPDLVKRHANGYLMVNYGGL